MARLVEPGLGRGTPASRVADLGWRPGPDNRIRPLPPGWPVSATVDEPTRRLQDSPLMALIEMLNAPLLLWCQWLRKEIWSDSAMSPASTARSPSPSRSRACRRSLSELVAGLCAAVRSGSAPCSSMRCA